MKISLVSESTALKTDVDNVVKNIDVKMQEMFKKLTFSDSKVKALEFDSVTGQWMAEVNVPAFEKLGIDKPTTGKLKVTIGSNGDSIDIPEKAEHPGLSLCVQSLVEQPAFASLKVLYGKLHMEEANPSDPTDLSFNLYVGKKGSKNLKLELEILSLDGTFPPLFSIKSGNSEQALLQNSEFAQLYVDAISKDSSLYSLKNSVDELEYAISLLPEDYKKTAVSEIWSWFGGTLDKPFKNFDFDVISGAIPDNYANSIIDFKEKAIAYSLMGKIPSLTSFDELGSAAANTFGIAAKELNYIKTELDKLSAEKYAEGTLIEKTEFLKILDSVRKLGSSDEYYGVMKTLEYKIINKLQLSLNDVVKTDHATLEEIKLVFASYTAHLDDPKLDSLAYPIPKGDEWKTLDDDKKDLYKKASYFGYVMDKIVGNAGSKNVQINSGIDKYESWTPILAPVNPLDTMPVMKEDDLKDFITKRVDELKEELLDLYGVKFLDKKALDPLAVEKFFEDYNTVPKDEDGNPIKDGDGNLINTELEDHAELIAGKGYTRYSKQVEAVMKILEELKTEVKKDDALWVNVPFTDRAKILLNL
jgi:hypothetical protein